MPCYDPRADDLARENAEKVKWFEAALCAVFNELERRGILENVLFHASRQGEINLPNFWKEHMNADQNKVLDTLNRFSSDELEILKRIINNQPTKR